MDRAVSEGLKDSMAATWEPGASRYELMKTYPIFAIIEDRPCLVVGGGRVGERKVQDLREAGGRVTVVSQGLTPVLKDLARAGQIDFLNEEFTPEHLQGMVLVMAATDDPGLNARVSAAAREQGIWVNVADQPELCTFIVPAQVRRGDRPVAIGTAGASPARARGCGRTCSSASVPNTGLIWPCSKGCGCGSSANGGATRRTPPCFNDWWTNLCWRR